MAMLEQKEIDFIKNHLEDADKLLHSNDPNDLIYALHDFTVDILMFTNDVPDEVRFAEQIIDNIVADHDHGRLLTEYSCLFDVSFMHVDGHGSAYQRRSFYKH